MKTRIAIASIILILYLVKRILPKSTQQEKKLPFQKKEYLLNIPERDFFENLQNKLPTEYTIYPQISLNSIIQVSIKWKEFWNYHNKINRKILDFVIFEKKYLHPIIAIEYDWKTHNREDRKERDLFVDQALEAAWIPIIHVKHQSKIDYPTIMNEIEELLFPQIRKTESTNSL